MQLFLGDSWLKIEVHRLEILQLKKALDGGERAAYVHECSQIRFPASIAADVHMRECRARPQPIYVLKRLTPPPTRASDPDPWELGDELVEEEDYSQAEAW